jgi:hypothetical protein
LIYHGPGFADRLKIDASVIRFDHHEMIVRIEALCTDRAAEVYPFAAALSACSADEIMNTLLRLDSFVKVVVPREDYIDAIANQQRFQSSS